MSCRTFTVILVLGLTSRLFCHIEFTAYLITFKYFDFKCSFCAAVILIQGSFLETPQGGYWFMFLVIAENKHSHLKK